MYRYTDSQTIHQAKGGDRRQPNNFPTPHPNRVCSHSLPHILLSSPFCFYCQSASVTFCFIFPLPQKNDGQGPHTHLFSRHTRTFFLRAFSFTHKAKSDGICKTKKKISFFWFFFFFWHLIFIVPQCCLISSLNLSPAPLNCSPRRLVSIWCFFFQ